MWILFCRGTPMPSKYEQVALRLFQSRNLPLVSHNKTIGGSWFRPDFVFKRENVAVIVECDENRHASYDKIVEARREDVVMSRLRENGFSTFLVRYDPAPENVRPCVRAAEVSDLVHRLLHGLSIRHLLWREHVTVRDDDETKIIVY
jgi:hypothetical protein